MMKCEALQEMPGVWRIQSGDRVLASVTTKKADVIDMRQLTANMAAALANQPLPHQIEAQVRSVHYRRGHAGIEIRACVGATGNSVLCAEIKTRRHVPHKSMARLMGMITTTAQGLDAARTQKRARTARPPGR